MHARFAVLHLFALAIVLSISSTEAQALTVPVSPTFLVLDSQPGDLVGQGQQRSFSAETARFEAFQSFESQVLIRVFPNAGGFAVLQFSAPSGGKLVPGTYAGTTRSSDASHAGLDSGVDGRGCNTAFGSFVINEASFEGLFGPVISFDASFEFHCERPDAPALFGGFSDIVVGCTDPRSGLWSWAVSQGALQGPAQTR